MSQSPTDLLALLKGKYSSLTIGFNDDHACNYATAQEWHDEYGMYHGHGRNNCRIAWASEDERMKAIEGNAVWTIQWYPVTPVGFCCVGASTFEAALAFALTT